MKNDYQKLLPGTHITVYATVINSDGNEGRGADIDIAYFLAESEARKYGRGKDVMGSDGRVQSRQAIIGADREVYLAKQIRLAVDTVEQQRLDAMAKLRLRMTPEEIKLLGITDD